MSVLAQVNQVLVPEEQINLESGSIETGSIEEKRAEAARRLAIRELLRQRAKILGIDVHNRLDAAIDELLEREVQVPAADEAACRRYFDANRERFVTPIEVEARHILLAAAPDDGPGRSAARDQAEQIVKTLQDKPEQFAELASQHSRCPSARNGGRLGIVTRGATVPELESVIMRLPVSLAARPVETRYGFHVVEVLARAGGELLGYEAVAHLIADYLRERSWRHAVTHYLQVMIADAELVGIDFETSSGPLLQ